MDGNYHFGHVNVWTFLLPTVRHTQQYRAHVVCNRFMGDYNNRGPCCRPAVYVEEIRAVPWAIPTTYKRYRRYTGSTNCQWGVPTASGQYGRPCNNITFWWIQTDFAKMEEKSFGQCFWWHSNAWIYQKLDYIDSNWQRIILYLRFYLISQTVFMICNDGFKTNAQDLFVFDNLM